MENKIYFNEQDMALLKRLSEEELYILNIYLSDITTDAKRNITNVMFGKQKLCELVNLTETSYKEVAERNGFTPEKSTGEYSTSGITYDTASYNSWVVSHRHFAKGSRDFLKKFSFYNVLKKLKYDYLVSIA